MIEIEIIFTGFSLSSSVLVYFLTMYKKILTLWCVILFNFQQLAIFLDGYKGRENTSCHNLHSFFFYKNLFYKNVEAEIDPNFKNVLRTFLMLRVD